LQDEKTKNTINSGHKYPDLLHGQLIFCMVDALVESWYPSGSFKTVLAINIMLYAEQQISERFTCYCSSLVNCGRIDLLGVYQV
jgi:hypothetical protein